MTVESNSQQHNGQRGGAWLAMLASDWLWHGSLFPVRITVAALIAAYFAILGFVPSQLPAWVPISLLVIYALACAGLWCVCGARPLSPPQRRLVTGLDVCVIAVAVSQDPVDALPLIFLLAINPLEMGVRFGLPAFRLGVMGTLIGVAMIVVLREYTTASGLQWDSLGAWFVLGLTIPYGLLTVFGQAQVRAELERVREELDFTAKTTGVGLFVESLVDDFRRWDSQAKILLGWEADADIRGTAAHALRHVLQGDEQGIRGAIARTKRTGEDLHHRFRVRDLQTGESRVVEARARTVTNANGVVEQIAGTFIDVTRSEQAAHEISALRDRFESAVQAAGIGTWTYWPESGNFLGDRRLGEILVVEPSQLRRFQDLLALLDPDSCSAAQDWAQQIAKDGVSRDIRLKRRLPTGATGWLNVRARGTAWDGNRVVRISGAAWDITALVDAETAAERFRERHDLALRSARVGCWYWDAAVDRYEVDPWAESLLGYSPKESKKTMAGFLEAIHPEDAKRVHLFVSDALQNKDRFDVEYRAQNRHPEMRWMRSFGQVFRNDKGVVTSVSGVLIDITTEAQLRLELERSNAELDDFAHVVSHDLREPLRGIRNYADYLHEDYAEALDEQGLDMLSSLSRLGQRLSDLVVDLQTYAQVGQAHLKVDDYALDDVLNNVLETLEFMLAESAVSVVRPEVLPTVRCDATRIGEVFRNLITNAIKYNDKSAKRVEIGYDQQQHAVFVRDNGLGIKPEHQERVFTMFRRLHAVGDYGGGTGAGLALTKRIVERHGGKIWLESEPGVGTTFYFTIGQIEDSQPTEASAPQ